MTPAVTILTAVFLPLAGAALIVLAGARPNLRETVTLVTAGLLFANVITLIPEVAAGGRPATEPFQVLPHFPLVFIVEPLGMVFATIASSLWILTSIYSIGYMRGNDEHNQTRYYVSFAIALASTMGIAFGSAAAGMATNLAGMVHGKSVGIVANAVNWVHVWNAAIALLALAATLVFYRQSRKSETASAR